MFGAGAKLAAMSVEIRTCTPDRWDEMLTMVDGVFAENPPPEALGRFKSVSDLDRFLTALDRDRVVGASGVLTLQMTVPGGTVPAGGVTLVGVMPTHRRQGVMSSIMRRLIDDCHARGEPVAILWASEGAIYQRFGYGLATASYNLEADTRYAKLTRDWPREGSFRMLAAQDAATVIAPIYEKARSARPGFLGRNGVWWRRIVEDHDPARREDHKRIVVFETGDGPEAYAVYCQKIDWDYRGSIGTVKVLEAIGSTPRGTREIWRYLMGIDLTQTVKAWTLPADHPIFALMAEPRRLGVTVGDALWLRIVDVVRALEGRRYGLAGSATGRIVMELRDDYCPWNEGRWQLEVADGVGRLQRSQSEPDLALDANDLGSIYLGGFTVAGLAQAGRIVELRSGGLAAADTLLRGALQPWCPEEF